METISTAGLASIAMHIAIVAAFAAHGRTETVMPRSEPLFARLELRPVEPVSLPAYSKPEEPMATPQRFERRSSPVLHSKVEMAVPAHESPAAIPDQEQGPSERREMPSVPVLSVGVGQHASEPSVALWIDLVEQKLRTRGERMFPSKDGTSLYGTPVLSFEVSKDGRLIGVKVERTSGDVDLDDKAVEIVKASAPFAPLPKEIEGNLRLARRLAFSKQ